MWNEKFPKFLTLRETANFAVIHNPDKDPFDDSRSNYYLVYKPLSTVEMSNNSYAIMMMYLGQAEGALKMGETGEEEPNVSFN